MSCFFSVIIPTYNRRYFLEKAILSVIKQSFQNWELLIIDDGSTDNTVEIQKKYQHCKIRWYFKQHQGASAARNFGISLACGEWLAFLDSDDLWEVDKLKLQYQFIQQFPRFLIFQTNEIWIRKGKRVNPTQKHLKKRGDLFENSLQTCLITLSAVCIHKKLLKQIGFFDERLLCCEDYDLWIRITANYQVGLLQEFLVTRFEGHQGQLSHSFIAMDRFRLFSICKLLLFEFLTKKQRNIAQFWFEQKYHLFIQGAKKRKKDTENLKQLVQQFWQLKNFDITSGILLKKLTQELLVKKYLA